MSLSPSINEELDRLTLLSQTILSQSGSMPEEIERNYIRITVPLQRLDTPIRKSPPLDAESSKALCAAWVKFVEAQAPLIRPLATRPSEIKMTVLEPLQNVVDVVSADLLQVAPSQTGQIELAKEELDRKIRQALTAV